MQELLHAITDVCLSGNGGRGNSLLTRGQYRIKDNLPFRNFSSLEYSRNTVAGEIYIHEKVILNIVLLV
jgi:hypothetical protein